MNLIDRYVNEVTDRLPEKMREDLGKEIRSLIEDTLEDRARQTGKAVDDEILVNEVLKDFGSPAKMAASYLPPRYLIGPRLYPIFWLVFRIVLGITALVWVITLGVNLAETATSFAAGIDLLVSSIASFFGSAMAVLGNIVLIFIFIEWLMPKVTKEKEDNWDPRSLEDRREQDKVSLPESIAGIVFTLIVMLLFNVYPQWIGVGFLDGGKITFSPMLTDVFFKFLPALNIVWILELVKYAVLIRDNKWAGFTRWMDIGLHVAGIAIAAAMIAGAPIAVLPANSVFGSEPDLVNLFKYLVSGVLVVIIVGSTVDVVRSIVRMFKK
jgi:hypothetical protein